MNKSVALLLLFAFALSGCSSFSKTGRQQRAYEKYVRKSSITRVKQQSRFRSGKPQMPSQPMEPSGPVETMETGPQAIPTDG